jgi:hypothetical protein
MNKQEPISDQANKNVTGCARFLFAGIGLLFALIGFGMLVYMAIIPAYRKYVSKSWPTADCRINRAEMVEHHGDDSTTYSIDFSYTFEADGDEYSGSRFSFVDGSTNRAKAKKQLKAFPPGSVRKCFYNPKDPYDCVLDRTNPDQSWISIFVPSVFTMVGSIFFFVGAFGLGMNTNSASLRRAKAESGSPVLTSSFSDSMIADIEGYATIADEQDAEWAAPRKLKPVQSRLKTFIGLVFFGVFWNGILSIFFFVPEGPFAGGGWFAIGFSLFMIPFLLVGLALIVGAIYFFVAMFNPTVEIALSTGAVPLGGQFDVAWEIGGKFERIKNLEIAVEAIQSATYQRGTDTVTDVEVFELLPVASIVDPTQIAFGSTSVTIPANTMHSFEAPRNEIKWKVVVHGKIPWAPDIIEDFEFRVTPKLNTSSNPN